MQLNVLQVVLQKLNNARLLNPAIVMGLSGGKDSLVLLDLITKVWEPKNIFVYHMYLVPGIKYIESRLDQIIESYKIPKGNFRYIIHPCSVRDMMNGVYCDEKDDLKDVTLSTLWQYLLKETGTTQIYLGVKKGDSSFIMKYYSKKKRAANPFLQLPLWDWNNYEILAYLRIKGIKVPEEYKYGVRGIDLVDEAITFLYDYHREDYETMEEYFPYIGSVIKWREIYGVVK